LALTSGGVVVWVQGVSRLVSILGVLSWRRLCCILCSNDLLLEEQVVELHQAHEAAVNVVDVSLPLGLVLEVLQELDVWYLLKVEDLLRVILFELLFDVKDELLQIHYKVADLHTYQRFTDDSVELVVFV
jgi:hypothetical protein